MKIRIISAAAAILLLAFVVCIGSAAIGIAVFVLALAALYEYDKSIKRTGFKPVAAPQYISCIILLYLAIRDLLPESIIAYAAGNSLLLAAASLFILLVALFCFILFSGGKYNAADVALTLFGIFYIVFLFAFVILTRNKENGYLYIWLIFIGAWGTDTFAYFTGITAGKTKILPKISPKKSLEGSIGGVVGCMAATSLFGLYFNDILRIPIVHFAVLGFICGVISQLGDWSASAIKRWAGIKDFGNIMPGHGGVLDRLDSILFVAPAVYIYVSLFFRGA